MVDLSIATLNYQRVVAEFRMTSILMVLAPHVFEYVAGWWFQRCFIFHNICDVILPIDKLIFFKMVKTTNQVLFYEFLWFYGDFSWWFAWRVTMILFAELVNITSVLMISRTGHHLVELCYTLIVILKDRMWTFHIEHPIFQMFQGDYNHEPVGGFNTHTHIINII